MSGWPSPAAKRTDDPRDRRPGRRLDRDRLARPQRPRRRRRRDARRRRARDPRARLHREPQRARALRRPHRPRRRRSSRSSIPRTSRRSSPARPRRCTSRTCAIVLSPTQHEHDREVSLLDRLMHGATDGALIILPEESSEELERRLDSGYPFVVVDPLDAARRAHPLGLGGAHARAPTRRCATCSSLGHRRIGAITGPRGWVATEDRRRGYRAALAVGGHPARPRARGRGRLRDRPRARGRRAPARPARPADGDLRVQRQHRDRRDPGGARARPARSRRTSRSSASTTSSTRRS